jgi:hypothetical protein
MVVSKPPPRPDDLLRMEIDKAERDRTNQNEPQQETIEVIEEEKWKRRSRLEELGEAEQLDRKGVPRKKQLEDEQTQLEWQEGRECSGTNGCQLFFLEEQKGNPVALGN